MAKFRKPKQSVDGELLFPLLARFFSHYNFDRLLLATGHGALQQVLRTAPTTAGVNFNYMNAHGRACTGTQSATDTLGHFLLYATVSPVTDAKVRGKNSRTHTHSRFARTLRSESKSDDFP